MDEIRILERLSKELAEAIEYEYECDRGYLRHYTLLVKRKRIIDKAIRRLKKCQK